MAVVDRQLATESGIGEGQPSCDDHKEGGKRSTHDELVEIQRKTGSEKGSKEKAQRDEASKLEVSLTPLVVLDQGQNSDWGKECDQRGALRFVLGKTKSYNDGRNDDYASTDSE